MNYGSVYVDHLHVYTKIVMLYAAAKALDLEFVHICIESLGSYYNFIEKVFNRSI